MHVVTREAVNDEPKGCDCGECFSFTVTVEGFLPAGLELDERYISRIMLIIVFKLSVS
jgi:hypothetical protein